MTDHCDSGVEKESRVGINPHHFFGGGVCREEATSAFLATLIEQSREFRTRFLRLCGIPYFELREVEVERQCRDVTISGDRVHVIVENKITSASKMPGQLVRYYTQLKQTDPESTVHCVYLSPERSIGISEVEQVPKLPEEFAESIAWRDLETQVQGLSDIDLLFAEKGIETILLAIKNRKVRSARQYSDDEDAIRDFLAAVEPHLIEEFPDRQICRFALEIWSYGDITFFMALDTIARKDSVVELNAAYQFKPRGRPRQGEGSRWAEAKQWYSGVKNIGRWDGFQLEVDDWMRKEEIIEEPEDQIVSSLRVRFAEVLRNVEKEFNSITP